MNFDISGTYAFRLPDSDGNGGIWVSYEDADTAGQKADYVKWVTINIPPLTYIIIIPLIKVFPEDAPKWLK